MNQILRCDWLPGRARWSYLARPGLPAVSRKKTEFPLKPYNKSFIDQAFSVRMAGYWPRSFFFRVYGPRLRLGPLTHKKRTWPISSHLDHTPGQ